MEPFKKILRTPSAFVLVITAIVALIGIMIQSNTEKEVARIPIDATLTAETKLTQIAFQPTNTVVVVPTYTPTPVELTHDEILAQAKEWQLQISDSFDNNKNGWSVNTSDDFTKTLDGNGKYTWAIKSDSQWLLIEIPEREESVLNFFLSIDCKRVSGNGSPCGFIFRDNEEGRYLFRIRDLTQQYLFFATYKQPEDRKDFFNSDDWPVSPAIKPGEVNTLQAVIIGNQYMFYVNDQFVDEFTYDSLLKEGLIGIYVAIDPNDNAIYEFDNFELRLAPEN